MFGFVLDKLLILMICPIRNQSAPLPLTLMFSGIERHQEMTTTNVKIEDKQSTKTGTGIRTVWEKKSWAPKKTLRTDQLSIHRGFRIRKIQLMATIMIYKSKNVNLHLCLID
jgi:hypothetical protein